MITQVMGILNVTPDSFSDGGRFVDLDVAVAHARRMVDEGASVIDVGGESTRPGAQRVSVDEELDRVVPVVAAVSTLGTTISVDTRRAEVAVAAVAAGASLINDVSASLWPVAAETGAGWIAMHMQGDPTTMQRRPSYVDPCGEILEFLVERADQAAESGVSDVWIDPGFGFGKTHEHNCELVAGIDRFVESGYPVVLGVSRKATLGALTGASDSAGDTGWVAGEPVPSNTTPAPPEDRIEFAVAFATWAMMAGVQMIRAHDVAVHVDAARYVYDRHHQTV